MVVVTKARVHAEVNSQKPKEYYIYKNHQFEVASSEPYEILSRLGSGKYSEVFKAVNNPQNRIIQSREVVVLKVLKPIKLLKIRREIKILQNLFEGENIIKLLNIVKSSIPNTPALVFEYVKNDFNELYPKLTDHDIRFYMFQLLKALAYCHSMGVMHRDVKPSNIVIDHANKKLKLIDWGLAEFYHPEKEYSIKVLTMPYQPPELLVGYGYYDYSLDIWMVGCILAGMVFKKTPFFRGNSYQLVVICNVLGYDDLINYSGKYEIELDPYLVNEVSAHKRKPWNHFVHSENEHLTSPECFDLLTNLLRYDHQTRLTAEEAMNHPYFTEVVKGPQSK